jgi:hypothetical protein
MRSPPRGTCREAVREPPCAVTSALLCGNSGTGKVRTYAGRSAAKAPQRAATAEVKYDRAVLADMVRREKNNDLSAHPDDTTGRNGRPIRRAEVRARLTRIVDLARVRERLRPFPGLVRRAGARRLSRCRRRRSQWRST